MDSLVLIERLDELMAEAKPIPFTREARVDRDEVYKILDRIRTTLPVEFERVRWLGKEAEQEEGLEAKLGEINEAISELRRAQREHATGGPPLTVAAAEQVREIIEAAERTAEHVEREAGAEAQRMREEADAQLRRAREEAERHLRETRERTATEAADYLRRVEEATKKMLERANTAGTEMDGMLQRLRGSGGSVIEELEAIMSGLTEIEVRRNKQAAPAGARASGGPAQGGGQATAARPATRVARVPDGARRPAPTPPAQQPQPADPQQRAQAPRPPATQPRPPAPQRPTAQPRPPAPQRPPAAAAGERRAQSPPASAPPVGPAGSAQAPAAHGPQPARPAAPDEPDIGPSGTEPAPPAA
jgi:cell division septum initiation protein DivIVA